MERQQDLDKSQKMDGWINNVQNLKLQSEYTNNATYFHWIDTRPVLFRFTFHNMNMIYLQNVTHCVDSDLDLY